MRRNEEVDAVDVVDVVDAVDEVDEVASLLIGLELRFALVISFRGKNSRHSRRHCRVVIGDEGATRSDYLRSRGADVQC